MGVVGLTSFVDENEELLMSRVVLSNCRVVLDGHSLVHSLYFSEKVDYRFGGDYSRFQSVCESFLNQLAESGVEIIVVFDGLLNIDDKKLNTTVSRAKSRVQVAKELSQGGRGQLLPLFATSVLIRILRKRGLKFVQCVGDADSLIASLSNHFGAPVISSDSDFFIFDLTAGYVPFDSFEWKTATSQGIRSRLYRVDNLLKFFPQLARDCLPLFACVCGNDFVRSNHFGTFFQSLKLPEKSKRLRVNEKHRRMLGFLAWLETKSLDEAIEAILHQLRKENRERVEDVIRANLVGYNCQLDIPDGFELRDVSQVTDVLSQSAAIRSDWLWSDDLLKDYLEGLYPPSFCYIRGLRKFFFPTLVEDFSQPSAYQCAIEVRKVIYSLLEEVLPGEAFEDATVNEYGRIGSQLEKLPVKFNPNRLSHINIEGRLDSLSLTECQQLFFLALELEPVEQIGFDDRNFLAATAYWVKHAEPKVKGAEFAAVLINRCRAYAGDSAKDIKSRFDCSPDFIAKRRLKLRPEILHSLCQWQAVYHSVGWLNFCLRRPFPEKNVGRLYSGRFIYNLSVELTDCGSMPAKLNELVPEGTQLRDQFEAKLKMIAQLAGQDVVDALMTSPKKKFSKSRRSARPAAVDKENAEVNSVSPILSSRKSSFVDAENKFALLSLMDC